MSTEIRHNTLERFSALVALVVGINQFTFALGPSLVGVIRDWSGGYGWALGACTALQAIGATLLVLGLDGAERTRRPL